VRAGHDNMIRVAGFGLRDHVADAVAVHIELLCADLPAGLTQLSDNVVDACVIPRAGGCAVSAVLVRDPLQLAHVHESTSSAGSGLQLALERVDSRRRRRCR
jgi:hypothetical protein